MEKNGREENPSTLQDHFWQSFESQKAKEPRPFVVVIFGGTGDLSQRKLLPTLFHLFAEESVLPPFSIIGCGSRDLSQQDYRSLVEQALKKHPVDSFRPDAFQEFAKRVHYFRQDLQGEGNLKPLADLMDQVAPEGAKGYDSIFYLSVPPALVRKIFASIKTTDGDRCFLNRRIVIEKPFGHDRKSAVALNRELSEVFQEKQIFRIDHYLGKDTVQSLMFFRFGNGIFEPLWNRNHIDHVQITVAETLGIEQRARFYEQAGVIRDIVQNHLLQLVALVAMEPPVGFQADLIRDERVKVFRSLRPWTEQSLSVFSVQGQYDAGPSLGQAVAGYREEDGVSPQSQTATFFAGKFFIDNWRWAGVPFYVRSGKRLAATKTEISVQFKQPPLRLLARTCENLLPNTLIFSIQPQKDILLRVNIKSPGIDNRIEPVSLEFNYDHTFAGHKHSAYERLIVDCLKGDLTLFARQDGVEAMWGFVDPVIAYGEQRFACEPIPAYPAGSWGPALAEELLTRDGRRWHQ